MNEKLFIVADLGLLRAYREVQGATDRRPHLELIEELKPESAHQKLSDQLPDQAGRFPRGSGAANIPGDLSAGERLKLEAELTRRLIRQLAGRISALLAADAVGNCSLAASPPIHRQLLEAIDARAHGKIRQVLAANLTKTGPSEVRAHFLKAIS